MVINIIIVIIATETMIMTVTGTTAEIAAGTEMETGMTTMGTAAGINNVQCK